MFLSLSSIRFNKLYKRPHYNVNRIWVLYVQFKTTVMKKKTASYHSSSPAQFVPNIYFKIQIMSTKLF